MKLWKYVSVFVLLAFIPSLIYMIGVIVDMCGGGAVILWGTRVALTTVFTIIIGLTYYPFYYPFASYIKSYIRLLVVGFAQIFILGVFSAYVVFVENILTENKTQR